MKFPLKHIQRHKKYSLILICIYHPPAHIHKPWKLARYLRNLSFQNISQATTLYLFQVFIPVSFQLIVPYILQSYNHNFNQLKWLLVTYFYPQVSIQKPHLPQILCLFQVCFRDIYNVWHHNFNWQIFLLVTHLHPTIPSQRCHLLQILYLIQVLLQASIWNISSVMIQRVHTKVVPARILSCCPLFNQLWHPFIFHHNYLAWSK